ncbi:MAG: hypothetical protein HZB24_12280 [Desulfobacterales bacterium]|nr:hypothetical protein [Desulfobacterales bacterium]
MSMETDLKRELVKNDYELYITEVDELIAAWRYQKANQFARSADFSRVPEQWRYAAPTNATDNLQPCHISYRVKGCHAYSQVRPAPELGGTAARAIPSLTELDAAGFAKRNVSPYISPILDVYTLALVCKDLGLTGRAETKIINGRQYVIFKGYPGLRKLFPGTKYLADNRKVIQMAIGGLGIKHFVKSGAMLTIWITVPLTILECFLKDQYTMSALIGNVASDLAKIGIGSVMAAIAGLGVGMLTSIAWVPIGVTILVGLGVGLGLEWLDKKYDLTGKLVAALEKLGDQMAEVQALSKLGQYQGQEAQFIGQAKLSAMQPFGR